MCYTILCENDASCEVNFAFRLTEMNRDAVALRGVECAYARMEKA